MNDKFIIFIIGLLLGTVISTGSIYIYTVANKSNDTCSNNIPMNGGDFDRGGRGKMNETTTPPELPNGEQPNQNTNNSEGV